MKKNIPIRTLPICIPAIGDYSIVPIGSSFVVGRFGFGGAVDCGRFGTKHPNPESVYLIRARCLVDRKAVKLIGSSHRTLVGAVNAVIPAMQPTTQAVIPKRFTEKALRKFCASAKRRKAARP